MVQILNRPGFAQLLGTGLGQGVSQGLQQLAEEKLQNIQKNRLAEKFAQTGLMSPQEAQLFVNLPESVQREFAKQKFAGPSKQIQYTQNTAAVGNQMVRLAEEAEQLIKGEEGVFQQFGTIGGRINRAGKARLEEISKALNATQRFLNKDPQDELALNAAQVGNLTFDDPLDVTKERIQKFKQFGTQLVQRGQMAPQIMQQSLAPEQQLFGANPTDPLKKGEPGVNAQLERQPGPSFDIADPVDIAIETNDPDPIVKAVAAKEPIEMTPVQAEWSTQYIQDVGKMAGAKAASFWPRVIGLATGLGDWALKKAGIDPSELNKGGQLTFPGRTFDLPQSYSKAAVKVAEDVENMFNPEKKVPGDFFTKVLTNTAGEIGSGLTGIGLAGVASSVAGNAAYQAAEDLKMPLLIKLGADIYARSVGRNAGNWLRNAGKEKTVEGIAGKLQELRNESAQTMEKEGSKIAVSDEIRRDLSNKLAANADRAGKETIANNLTDTKLNILQKNNQSWAQQALDAKNGLDLYEIKKNINKTFTTEKNLDRYYNDAHKAVTEALDTLSQKSSSFKNAYENVDQITKALNWKSPLAEIVSEPSFLKRIGGDLNSIRRMGFIGGLLAGSPTKAAIGSLVLNMGKQGIVLGDFFLKKGKLVSELFKQPKTARHIIELMAESANHNKQGVAEALLKIDKAMKEMEKKNK